MTQTNSATTGPDAGGQPAGERLLAGKYKTIEELERAYDAQMTETNKIIRDRDGLKRQVDVLVPLVKEPVASGGQPAGSAGNSPLDALAESAGVTPDQLVAAMQEVARSEIRPVLAGLGARQEVAQRHPDFVKFESEVHQFLAANPEVADTAKEIGRANPAAAVEYSFLRWKTGQPAPAAQTTDVTGTETTVAKLDAQLGGGGGRTMVTTQSQVEAALKHARETGNKSDWTAYMALALGDDTNR